MSHAGPEGGPAPRSFPANYVEMVRVSWERELERAVPGARPSRGDPRIPQQEYLLLTKGLAPRVHRIAAEVAQVLLCREPFLLYQTRNPLEINAQALSWEKPFGIRLIGPAVTVLDDAGLRAMLGHEFGHYLAHGPTANPPSMIHDAARRSLQSELTKAACVAAELTADRFALLACQDLDAAVHLEVVSATGATPAALGARASEYLVECCASVEAGTVEVTSGSYPSHQFRLFASWLFWRSDVYQSLTGDGPADMTLAQVDARLRAIVVGSLLPTDLESAPPRATWAGDTATAHPGGIELWEGPTAAARALFVAAAARAQQQVGALLGRQEAEHLVQGSPAAEADDSLDDLERRFRALEARSASSDVRGNSVDPAVEARFQALEEEAARNGK